MARNGRKANTTSLLKDRIKEIAAEKKEHAQEIKRLDKMIAEIQRAIERVAVVEGSARGTRRKKVAKKTRRKATRKKATARKKRATKKAPTRRRRAKAAAATTNGTWTEAALDLMAKREKTTFTAVSLHEFLSQNDFPKLKMRGVALWLGRQAASKKSPIQKKGDGYVHR